MPTSECPFRAGDIITIRDWDDMAAEYTYDKLLDCIVFPSCPVVFVDRMRYACGESYEVSHIEWRRSGCWRIRFEGDQGYTFTPSMMRLATKVIDEPVDVPDDEYISLLGL